MTDEELGTKADELVQNGITWMEKTFALGWPELRLFFREPVSVRGMTKCPLSQVSGMQFSIAVKHYGLRRADVEILGFSVPYPPGYASEARRDYSRKWEELTAAWQRRIDNG